MTLGDSVSEGVPETFAGFADGDAKARFSDWLRSRAEPHWRAAVTHRFTVELAEDRIDDAVFRRYLIQDYAFIETLTGVVGFAVGHAPAMPEKKVLAGFLSLLTGDENDYFERAFTALGIPVPERGSVEAAPATRAFADLMGEAAKDGYAEVLGVLLAAEWIYLTWALARREYKPQRFYLREWIELHAEAGFEHFVGWLRDQVDTLGPALTPQRQRRVDGLFRRMAELEVAFFDAAYGAA